MLVALNASYIVVALERLRLEIFSGKLIWTLPLELTRII
jgi:hypothetical protein